MSSELCLCHLYARQVACATRCSYGCTLECYIQLYGTGSYMRRRGEINFEQMKMRAECPGRCLEGAGISADVEKLQRGSAATRHLSGALAVTQPLVRSSQPPNWAKSSLMGLHRSPALTCPGNSMQIALQISRKMSAEGLGPFSRRCGPTADEHKCADTMQILPCK